MATSRERELERVAKAEARYQEQLVEAHELGLKAFEKRRKAFLRAHEKAGLSTRTIAGHLGLSQSRVVGVIKGKQ